MAEQTGATEPGGTTAQSDPPKLLPWFLLYTLGRLAIAAALIGLLWLLGLPGTPGFLFGVLLAMPVSFLAQRPVRDRLTEALAARSVARRAAKENLRARLAGGEGEENA